MLVITTIVATLVGATLFAGGCASRPREAFPEPAGPAPRLGEIAQAWNARTDALDRLWARVVVVVDASGEKGKRTTEQGEGHLQVITPDRVALSLGKNVAGTFFWLGSDATRYWWIDMLDEERKYALVGTHANATPERAAELGVPVHPLDLVEVLGILPMDAQDGAAAQRSVAWDTEFGGYEVRGASRFGTKRIVVAPVTFEPRVIELLDASGEVVVRARHERFASVIRREGGGLPGSIATRLLIDLPTIDARVTLTLSEAENRGSRMPDAAFDLDGLLRRFRIDEVVDLDAELVSADAGRGA
jgi:hypothetical protein